MKAKFGAFEISDGKGDRVYINCSDEAIIMHPQEICNMNGLGMYGLNHLKDLAVAIIKYEKLLDESNNIMSKV